MVTLDRIPLARHAVGDAEVAAAERALRSGRLVLGQENERFERAIAQRSGREHAVAVSSGTVALEVALWVLGVAPGDRVLVTAFGFAAAANAVVRTGAIPIPVDVRGDTWTVDCDDVQRVADGARALVSIDQLGLVAEAKQLEQLASDTGIVLVGDAACGFGGVDSAGVPGGKYGTCAIMSFHPRKVITCGEGGAVVFDDDALASRARQIRNQGQRGPGAFPIHGTNARLAEASAAVGSAQMLRLDAFLTERRLLGDGYRQRLASLQESGRISWQQPPANAMHTYQTFAILLAQGTDRDAVRASLDAAGIESGPATYAFHRLEAFASSAQLRDGPLPVADALHDRGLALPLYIGMRSGELDRVCDALTEALS